MAMLNFPRQISLLHSIQIQFSRCLNSTGYLRTPISYKDSIFLPKTEFPHRIKADKISERDRDVEKKAKFDELYAWQLEHRKKENQFVLHDGPPYANGDVHIGHAVNKVLKDITIRNKLLSGKQICFVPGWDCHGLPIELKVLKDGHANFDPFELRHKAFDVAMKAKSIQMASFKKWGLLADWEHSYTTCHPDYIIKQWKLFHSLYEKKLVYQAYKPVYWSPSNRTSLAEAELEYNTEHISTAVYIKFPILKCPEFLKVKIDLNKLFALVWTTTPWTLPANQAICYSPSKNYCIVKHEDKNEYFLVATMMLESLQSPLNSKLAVIEEFNGSLLQDFQYTNPLNDKEALPFLHANHVTMSKGSGLVHMAPNHGLEDYAAAQEHNIKLSPCLVDANGCFRPEAGDVLAGKEVLGSGNVAVLNLMENFIVHKEQYQHSYPYDWRSHKPVILCSSHQWFIDTDALKEQAMDRLKEVELVPNSFQKQFLNQLKKSPPWCISRQRTWGVPIPVFYGESTPIINKTIIEHLCDLIHKKGIHFWWELGEEELLPQSLKKKCNLPNGEYKKGSDIFDIWFDSGISWNNVLPEGFSDVCIEGVDQLRGWFNSSLLTSIAERNNAPYRKLMVHGFITDAEGYKMSKSKGNVVSPSDITEGNKKNKSPAFGIDVLRWWTALHASHHENIALKSNIIEECSQSVLKIRNVLKFLLGSLQGFSDELDFVPFNKMYPLDQYMLHLTTTFVEEIEKSFESMQYKIAAREIVNYIVNDVSSFYLQIIKDRLYCDAIGSLSRNSCLVTQSVIFQALIRSLAPILPHLVEEAYLFHPDASKANLGVFRTDWKDFLKTIPAGSFPQSVLWAYKVRNVILKAERKTANMNVHIIGHKDLISNLKHLQQSETIEGHLSELFQVSKVSYDISITSINKQTTNSIQGTIDGSIAGVDGVDFSVSMQPTPLCACPRCRRFVSENESTLCRRCQQVMCQKSRSAVIN